MTTISQTKTYALQAIVTKYLGPTNTRGTRIKATCQARSVTYAWDHKLNVENNHRFAAMQFVALMGWSGEYTFGWLPDGRGVMVRGVEAP